MALRASRIGAFGPAASAILVTAIVAAACGGGAAAPGPTSAGPPTTPAALAAYRGADRQQVLEAAATKEGSLSWYTSLTGDPLTIISTAFRAKYPFITKVDILRAADNEIYTRATTEAQAGQPSFDVVVSPPTSAILLTEGKIATSFYSSALADIADSLKTGAKDGLVTSATISLTLHGFAYNTNLVPESAVPKTMLDLLSPALAGKMSLAGTTTGKRWLGAVLQGMGEEKGQAFLTQLAAQQRPTVQQISAKALLDLIAKGEVPASPTIAQDHVELAVKANHAPVKWVPLDPVMVNAFQVAFGAKAAHPAAALLFIDFLIGPDGQKIFRENGYTSADEKLSFPVWIPEQGKTADQVDKDARHWDQLFNSVFRR